MSSPLSAERILSPSSKDTTMATTPPQKPKGGVRPKQSPSGDVELSVFDILNIFCCRWFLSRPHLLANAISAQKAKDGNISWVEFTPQFHSHLVKCAVALVPHPVHKVKKVMFGYILELLNGDGHLAFFELQKGGRKANNAQKEKRRLARKRSRAAKREREREAAKAAKQPPRERQCVACGRKFNSRKTTSKHKCPKSKVVHVPREAASRQASQATSLAQLDKPAAQITQHAPPAPTNSNAIPAVTGVWWETPPLLVPMVHTKTGLYRLMRREQVERSLATGWTFQE
ncbi:hypothetical protein F5888DRAFT_1850646 [Russula emetica]|nr:hypothetical protein F5888DRAFT_1850646 [Russula emetica]